MNRLIYKTLITAFASGDAVFTDGPSGVRAFDASKLVVTSMIGTLASQAASSVAITGGNINGTPIGSTTPSTGAFTTLSATGIVSFTGGSTPNANGMLKLQKTDTDYGSGISLFYSSGTPNAAARAWQIAPNFIANGNLDFLVSSSNSTQPTTAAMALSSTGLVVNGTGTALTVNSTSAGGLAAAINSTSVNGTFFAVQNSGTNIGFIGDALNVNAGTLGDLAIRSQGTGLDFGLSGSRYMRLTSTGLAVTGALSATGVYSQTTGSAANVFVDSNGDLKRSTSSLKYKTDVRDYTRGLDALMSLRPVFYKGKAKSDEGRQFAGLIAEEVHDAGLTEFVQYDKDGKPDALAYQNMIALLVSSSKELVAELKALRVRVAALEASHA